MDFHLTDKQCDLHEFRAYFDKLMTPELWQSLIKRPARRRPLYQAAMKKMGDDGYIALSWPEKFGGRGLSALEQYMFIEEVARAGFHFRS